MIQVKIPVHLVGVSGFDTQFWLVPDANLLLLQTLGIVVSTRDKSSNKTCCPDSENLASKGKIGTAGEKEQYCRTGAVWGNMEEMGRNKPRSLP